MKYIPELLEDINKDPKLLEENKNSAVLKLIFEHAFIPEKKFILPEGNPPFKEDAAPLGMSPANLMMEVKKLYVFCREDLTPIRRETLFINLLENIHPSEAKLLLAVKDQKLTKLYKKITRKAVEAAGFIPPLPKKERV